MRIYVLRRLLLFLPTLVGASLLIFVLMRLVPGDIAEIIVYQVGTESAAIQQKQVQQIREELGPAPPWTILFPGLAISLAVFGLNLLGDAIRDLTDPRLRGGLG